MMSVAVSSAREKERKDRNQSWDSADRSERIVTGCLHSALNLSGCTEYGVYE